MVLRTPPPVKLLRAQAGGRWLAAITSEGPPDYTMLLRRPDAPPLAVLAEAKNCQGQRWALKQLHPHQADALADWHQLGGLACVLVGHQPTSTGYVLPWATLGPVWQRWRAGQVAGRRAAAGSASLGAGALRALGQPWTFSEGFYEAMIRA